jgi:methionyl-tRNA formyltransferase
VADFKLNTWPPKWVFMGTPEFAVPILKTVSERISRPQLVITQPDRPKGRGRGQPVSPPVKDLASALGVPVAQPETAKDPALHEQVMACSPDVILVAAYGNILPRAFLEIPASGCLNVHASMLPRYRGAAPINWAILNGEKVTGVSVQKVVFKLDAGDVLLGREAEIGPDETSEELYMRLSAMGAEAAVEALEMGRVGAALKPQDESMVSWAPILKKEDGELDWSKPASFLHDRVRGLRPWPGAYTRLGGRTIKVHKARLAGGSDAARPGDVIAAGREGIVVQAGGGALELLELQAEGGKRMAAGDFARGQRIAQGVRFNGAGGGGEL